MVILVIVLFSFTLLTNTQFHTTHKHSSFSTTANPSGTNILITEVLYDTPGCDSTCEWVELYNPTNTSISLDGWTLSDNVGTNTLPNVTLAPNDYFIFARDAAGFSSLYGFPPDADTMTLALGNSGDQLILRDNNGVEVDFVAWENYVTGWNIAAVDQSIRRISDANGMPVDTDSPSDWELSGTLGDPGSGYSPSTDSTPPTVTITNPQNGATVSNTVLITFDATDDSGTIATQRILIDGVQRSTSNSYSWDTTAESDGTHIIRAEATDAAGNLGYDEITVTVSNNPTTDPIQVYFTDPLAGLPWMDKPDLQQGNISTGIVNLLDSATTSIDAALYHLSWQPVIDALINAHNRGVTVRVAADGNNINEFQPLIDVGIPVTAIQTSYIMHNKFFIVDSQYVYTGSWNPTVTGTLFNANDMVLIHDTDVAAIYQAEFDQLFNGVSGKSKIDNNAEIAYVGSTKVEVYFSPTDNGLTRLIELIDSANSTIYISMFYLTENSIYDAIVRARDRGVTIKGVFDYRGWFNSYSEADDIISWGGGIIDANPGVYHHKFAVIDGKIVWTGSTNWSNSGFNNNDENSIVIHSAQIAAYYIRRTENFYQDAYNYDHSPTQAPRIVTRHYSGWQGENFISWRPRMNGNVAAPTVEKYLIWRWNDTLNQFELLQEVNWATSYYSDADISLEVTYYYVVSSVAWDGTHSTASAEFAEVQHTDGTNSQPTVYPATGHLNNWGTETINPTLQITNPNDGETVSGWVDITFSADDFSYISNWEIYIDGSLVSTESHFGWNTTTTADGAHTITVKAMDVFGNWGSTSIQVTVDNTLYQPPTMDFSSVKIMTYNIEASGTNPLYINVLKEENADIFILVEAGTFDDNGNETLNSLLVLLNEYFAPNELPYEATLTPGAGSKYTGIAIFSRFPIIDTNLIPIVTLDDGSLYDVSHDFLDVSVQIGTNITHVIGAHLKASSGASNELKREKAQEGIINYMDSLGSDAIIIYAGDLNSFSPEDTGNLAPNGNLGYGPVNMTINPAHPHSPINHTFTDVFRTLNPNDPGYTYPNPPYESRIDYIFVNSYLTPFMLQSTVGDTPSANDGSDHYSVDLTADLSSWNPTNPPPPPSLDHIVISEVFYDTPGKDSLEEWVELYNPTNTPIDLTGWTLEDNSKSWTLPNGLTIAPNSYLVIARNNQGFYKLYGFYPDVSGLKLALGNNGDQLILRDNNGVEVDFVAWENYVTGWNIAAPTGSSIERNPVNQDTDTVNDWIVAGNNGTPGTAPTTMKILVIASSTNTLQTLNSAISPLIKKIS